MAALRSMNEVEVWASGLMGPEGIAFDRHGNGYVGLSGPGGFLTPGPMVRIRPDGRWEKVTDTGGRVAGVAIDPKGNVAGCDIARHEMLLMTPEAKVSVLANHLGSRHFWSPNFAVYDASGALYMSDSGTLRNPDPTGCIYRIQPSGAVELWADGFYIANGLALAGDGSALFCIETPLRRVLRIPIRSDGSAGKAEVYAEGFAGSLDGMAFDAQGILYVTVVSPPYQIAVADKSGKVSVLLEDPEGIKMRSPTNCAFGGPNGDDLFIVSAHVSMDRMTTAGAILKVHLGIKGQPLHGG